MAEHLAWALAVCAFIAGGVIGRLIHQRASGPRPPSGVLLDRAYNEGYDDCLEWYGIDESGDDDNSQDSGAGMGEGRSVPPCRPELEASQHVQGDHLALGSDRPGLGASVLVDAEVTSEFLAAPLEPGYYKMYDEELAPEVLDAVNVPRPESATGLVGHGQRESSGPGHPSPYGGALTPAQRRRDKHKQRGAYAFQQPPEGAWTGDEPFCLDWTAELAAIRGNGQSDWFARMSAGSVDAEIAGWEIPAGMLERA